MILVYVVCKERNIGMELLNEVQKAINQLPHNQSVDDDYSETIQTLQEIDHYFSDNERQVSDTAHFIWTSLRTPELIMQGVGALRSWNYLLVRNEWGGRPRGKV